MNIKKNNFSFGKWCSDNKLYLLAFFLPVLSMTLVYLFKGVFPFGDEMYLRSDCYHQYTPYLQILQEKLHNGGSLFYTWEIGAGMNFVAIAAYYLASPLNLLTILWPGNMADFVSFSILLKMGLSGFAVTYYLTKKFDKKDIPTVIFGMIYALSAYFAAFSWNIMWLDCLILVPLIMLGLERLVNEDKCFLYCISLGLCIFTNYYIAIMVCLSVVLYFIVLVTAYKKERTFKNYFKTFLKFAFYSLIAGGLAACLLLPEFYTFSLSASSDIAFPKKLSLYFSILNMLTRQLINVPVHLGLEHYPNIYCGVAVFLLYPLYVMDKDINLCEKIGKSVLLLIFLTAYNLNIPNYIWHGFHYPNSLPARQSFIYIFFLLTMCYEGFKDIKQYSKKQIGTAFAIAFAIMLFIEECGLNEMYEWKSVYISAAFIIVYALLALFYNRNRLKAPILLFVLFASAIIECTINMENTGLSTTGRSAYLLDNAAVDNLLEKVRADDTGFYRIEKTFGLKTKNDAAWHGYPSISTFSSTAPSGITDLLGSLGCEHSMNAYSYHGSTLATASIFNVKYIISNKLLPESNLFNFYYGSDGEFLYENKYTLPVGFMVDSAIEDRWITNSPYNGIEVQNSFYKTNTGIEDVFEQVYEFRTDTEVNFTPYTNAHMYAVVRNVNCDTVTVTINGKMYTYSGLKNGNRIIDIGYVTTEDSVILAGDTSMNALVYAMDSDKFVRACNILSSGGLNVTKHSDTAISGTVNTARDGVMFFSIPYDNGWTVKVDGKKVSAFAIKDAVLGINLSAGEHTIELKYRPVNLIPGIMITLASILILAALTLFGKYVREGRIDSSKLPGFVQDYLRDDDSLHN